MKVRYILTFACVCIKPGRIYKKVRWGVVEGGTEYQAGMGQTEEQKPSLYSSLYCLTEEPCEPL